MWMFVASLASSPSVSRVVLLFCRLFPWPSRPPSSYILVSSRLSLRGGLSDLPPAPLFRPQSSTSSPQTSVRVTGERMVTFPRLPTPPLILPLSFSPSAPPHSLARSHPVFQIMTLFLHLHLHLSSSLAVPLHPPTFPLALTFNCNPVLFFPLALFIPSSPLSCCRSSLYRLICSFSSPFSSLPIYGSCFQSFYTIPLIFVPCSSCQP